MKKPSLLSISIFWHATKRALWKLNPFCLFKNPIIFITEIGAIIVTAEIFTYVNVPPFLYHIAVWLWFTVLFANFAEAVAISRNQAQASALKETRIELSVKRVVGSSFEIVPGSSLVKDDVVIVKAGDTIPRDGEIIEGKASIDESAITGESAPVIRAAGTDQSSVTGGTKVKSDELKIRITSNPGESFLDRMINIIEDAKPIKTANEIALTILLCGFGALFLIVIFSLKIFGFYFHIDFPTSFLIAFLICLIPTTIAGLLSAIGMAGISRLMQNNVIVMNGQAIEVAGDINLLLIDKTGTITVGNRQATNFYTAPNISEDNLVEASFLCSLQDQTTEGRSIVDLAKKLHPQLKEVKEAAFIPFSANTRMSGVDISGTKIRKGSLDAIGKFINGSIPAEIILITQNISKEGGTPLVVANDKAVLGVVQLKDVIKEGLKEKFSKFRGMGIKTVMMTGDNPITALAIAREAGVDDFIAEVSPEEKLKYLQDRQKEGHIVAMTGDGVNDAPALAYANVGVAMNAGSQAAKEAGNMIDLDSTPSKLFKIIEVGKQMLMTRGSLTTFSIANDVSKYFAIVPALLTPFFPKIDIFNVMRLHSPESAVVSAVIFNALIIIGLLPLAFKGTKLMPDTAKNILRRNLLIYGAGGVIVPFIGIKLINIFIVSMGILS